MASGVMFVAARAKRLSQILYNERTENLNYFSKTQSSVSVFQMKKTDRKRISSDSPLEENFAYSRAVVQGDWCFVSGTTGFDYATMTMPESAVEQAANAFRTIETTLQKAGFSLKDTVRIQYTVVAANIANEVQPILREFLDEIRPAATMVVAGLIQPEMKIEIEVTALKQVESAKSEPVGETRY